MTAKAGKWMLRRFAAALVAIAFIGILATAWVVQQTDRQLHADLIHQARLVAPAININRIKTLTGTEADLVSPDYQRLKEQLTAIRAADSQFRFLYLLGRKADGVFFFFVDNEPAESEDYSPPGQVYASATAALRRAFDTKTALVEGPVADEWGVWVSTLVPLLDPATGAVVAMMGMDIDARDWKGKVAAQAALPVALVLVLAILMILGLARVRGAAKLRESEKRYRLIAENTADSIAVLDFSLKNIYVSPSTTKMKGLPVEEILAQTVEQSMTPESVQIVYQTFQEEIALEQSGTADPARSRILVLEEYRKDGSTLWVENTLSFIRDEKKSPTGILSISRDITERKRAEEEIRRVNERLSIMVKQLEAQHAQNKIMTEMREFLQACSTAVEIGPIIARSMEKLFPDSDGALFLLSPSRTDLESIARWGNYPDTMEENVLSPDECWGLRRGSQYIVEKKGGEILCSHVKQLTSGTYACLPFMAKGEVLGLLHLRSHPELADGQKLKEELKEVSSALIELLSLAISNIKLREMLSLQSIKDPLTGLFNRRYLEETFLREVVRARRKKGPIGVIMVDIDHFKKFNDVFGHAAGDKVLAELAKFFTTSLRGTDIMCRYGGEEFALIMPEASLENSFIRAEQMVAQVKSLLISYNGQTLGPITLSMGVAAYPLHGEKLEELLRAADLALYRAKQSGRDRALLAEVSS